MRGSYLACRKMGKDKGGSGGTIINMASIAGLKVLPFGPAYSASKNAVVGFTRALGVS